MTQVTTLKLGFANATLIQDQGAILVDTGVPASFDEYRKQFAALQLDPQDLRLIGSEPAQETQHEGGFIGIRRLGIRQGGGVGICIDGQFHEPAFARLASRRSLDRNRAITRPNLRNYAGKLRIEVGALRGFEHRFPIFHLRLPCGQSTLLLVQGAQHDIADLRGAPRLLSEVDAKLRASSAKMGD